MDKVFVVDLTPDELRLLVSCALYKRNFDETISALTKERIDALVQHFDARLLFSDMPKDRKK